MLRVSVDAGRLSDIPALGQALGGKFIEAEISGDKAEVTILPVASLEFSVNVWNCQAELYLVHDNDYTLAEDVLDLDPEAVQALVDQVVHEDNGGAINMSGMYYPTSEESLAAFRRVMETATVKQREVIADG